MAHQDGDSDHASQVAAIALLAAWCEGDCSIGPLPSAEAFLASNPRARQLCEVVARSWDPSEPVAPSLIEHVQALQQQPGGDGSDSQQPQRPHLTPAEISQRSVDLLLREYYRMMQAQHAAQQRRPASGGGGLAQRLFLLLCPAGPEWLELQSLAAAAVWLVCGAASLIVWSSCLLVPAWLVAIRQLLLQQQQWQAAWLVCTGLLLLLAADSIHRARGTAAASTVTAASLKARWQANSSSNSSSSSGVPSATNPQLSALRGASRPAAGVAPKQHRPAVAAAAAAAAGIASSAAPSVGRGGHNNSGSGGPSSNSSGSTPSYLALLPEVSRLQAALGVSKSVQALTSRELLADELTRLCHVVGISVSPDMLASPEAMQATLARLQQSIGLA